MTKRLVVSYLTITLVILAVLVVPLGLSFAQRERDQLTTDIERDAIVVGSRVEDDLTNAQPLQFADEIQRYAERTGSRVVVTDASGISVLDTSRPDGEPRDFSTRPEIAAALRGERATGTRRSDTLDASLLYVAVPVASGGELHGTVRITYPTSEVDQRVRENWVRLGALSLVVLGVVTLVGWFLARSVSRPVRDLEHAAASLAAGDLSARAGRPGGPPELRRLAATFDGMAGRVEELVSSQRAFVADASHQLRTPLTALRLRLENLASESPPGGRGEVDAAIDEVNRLGVLVEDLLYLARSEGARPATEPAELVDLARERVETWSPLVEEQGMTLDLETTAGTVAVAAVPGAVEQMLDNLLANAIDAGRPGDRVTIRVDQAAEVAHLVVADTGPGMTSEQQARAFDRFWRGPGALPGGTGLGLAIVRQLAHASGGTVRLGTGPDGQGLVVTIDLPLAVADGHAPKGTR